MGSDSAFTKLLIIDNKTGDVLNFIYNFCVFLPSRDNEYYTNIIYYNIFNIPKLNIVEDSDSDSDSDYCCYSYRDKYMGLKEFKKSYKFIKLKKIEKKYGKNIYIKEISGIC